MAFALLGWIGALVTAIEIQKQSLIFWVSFNIVLVGKISFFFYHISVFVLFCFFLVTFVAPLHIQRFKKMENQVYQHHPTGDNPTQFFLIQGFLPMLSSPLLLDESESKLHMSQSVWHLEVQLCPYWWVQQLATSGSSLHCLVKKLLTIGEEPRKNELFLACGLISSQNERFFFFFPRSSLQQQIDWLMDWIKK